MPTPTIIGDAMLNIGRAAHTEHRQKYLKSRRSGQRDAENN